MLGVHEGHLAALLLGLGDDVEGQGGLAGGLRPVDLHDAAPGQAADAESQIQAQGARGNALHIQLRPVAEAHDGSLSVHPLDLLHGGRQLLAAVAAQGAEGVAGEALGVDPAEDVLTVADVPLHQSHVVLAVDLVHIAVGDEVAVAGRHFCFRHLFYQLFVFLPVFLQGFDGNEFYIKFLCQLLQFRCAHHGAVLPHDLAAETAFFQPCQTHQVYRSFRMTVSFQNAVFLGQKREHMTRPPKVIGPGVFTDTHSGSIAALFRRDACGGVYMVNRDGKGGTVIVCIVVHHLRKLQLLAVVAAHGHADQTFSVYCHKVYIFCGGKFCRTDEITFIFSVRVVGTEDDLSLAQILQGLFNGIESEIFHNLVSFLKIRIFQ